MNDWLAIGAWILILFGGLIPVPFAYRQRIDNRMRFRAVLWAAVIYLALQAGLYLHIYGQLRFENRDWLHALFVPIFLGLALPVIMAIIWFMTRKRSAR